METTKGRFTQQPWLRSALSDGLFILLPPFFSLLLVILFPEQFKVSAVMPVQYWIVLVVFIDVAHVYSTLYRTYFNPDKRGRQLTLLVIIPVVCYLAGVLLYFIDGLLFWRVLAYLAVYHFIRQQYGFMRLYSRREQTTRMSRVIDIAAIYTATIYPILFWHFDGTRNFNWFVEGDFISFPSAPIIVAFTWVYFLVIAAYLIKEGLQVWKNKHFNIPRNFLIAGTFLSWYFGIIYFNGDMAFTTLNVISHGIPYMALIWFFEQEDFKKKSSNKGKLLKFTFSQYGVWLFILIIVILAYIEEGLWDGLIWREHQAIFSFFSALPLISNVNFLTFLIPLLALPQSTHYILDGFIWRSRK
jgi:hypothetical protein